MKSVIGVTHVKTSGMESVFAPIVPSWIVSILLEHSLRDKAIAEV